MRFLLSMPEQKMVSAFEYKLKDDPFQGRQLKYPFFREKKFNGKRIYYLIYQDMVVVLMVAISDKKTQQVTIDAIRANLDVYNSSLRESLKKY